MVKNLPANAGVIRVLSLILGSWRSPGGRHGHPLQHSCLENPKDRRAWQATIHRVTKSQTRLKQLSTHAHTYAQVTFLNWQICYFVTNCQINECLHMRKWSTLKHFTCKIRFLIQITRLSTTENSLSELSSVMQQWYRRQWQDSPGSIHSSHLFFYLNVANTSPPSTFIPPCHIYHLTSSSAYFCECAK